MAVAERINFNRYKDKSKYTREINAGMTAGYDGAKVEDNPYFPRDSEQAQAWHFGYMGSQKQLNGSEKLCPTCLR